jgi:cellulose synthase operon protein YhjU
MGLWSAYFLAKLLLYGLGYIDFHPWENLVFAAFTALTPGNTRQRFAKNLIAVPVAVLLLYHDSWLPPIAQAMSQAQNLQAFSAVYLWELAGRVFSWRLMVELAALFAVYAIAARKLRMSTFAFIAILGVALAPHGRLWPQLPSAQATTPGVAAVAETQAIDLSAGALDGRLTQFYSEQKKVEVRFGSAAASDPPFDILIVHVCSLSWDDLKTLKIAPEKTVFGRFDLVLSDFSSGASYSGPAAIRLLRGACGQTPENKLYEPAEAGCFVMDGLQNAGFEPHWLMNHDGHFGNFFGDVRDRGGMKVALEDTGGAVVAQQSFDGSPIYGDYETLSKWWAKRLQNPAARVALYYNTISLHDGNRFVGRAHPDSSYAARFSQFSADIGRFLDDLRGSGRHVIVVFIAEHGAALAGDRRQISGLREIPTAAIAHVPVAIALVNAERSAQSTQERIASPVSYPAVNELLARFIADNPFAKPVPSLAAYTQALKPTDFVAENNGTTVMAAGGQYMMRSPDGAWSSLEGVER